MMMVMKVAGSRNIAHCYDAAGVRTADRSDAVHDNDTLCFPHDSAGGVGYRCCCNCPS